MVRPTAAATIHALDDHLLGRIIELAGREAGRAAASVCRHWRDVVFSAPGLWRTLRLAPTARDGAERCAWLAAKHRLLQRVGPLAEELDIDDFCELLRLVGGPDAASLAAGVLAHVQPERLLSLAFDCALYGADSSPRQQLAEQHYDTALGVAAAMLACLLQQAPHLAALTVQAGFPLELPQCVAQRSGLTRLALRYCGLTQLPAGPYLSDLQQLELTGHNFNALPPALAAATALRQLILRHSDSPEPPNWPGHDQEGGLQLEPADVAAVLGQLRALLHLGLDGQPWPGLPTLLALRMTLPLALITGVRAGAEVPPHLVEAVEAFAQGPCPELGKPLYGETFGHYS